MATLVCFHAHPDDEAISTGGVMARASAEGHRVVLVTATRGEHGEIQPGVLDDGEQLWERRVREVDAAASVLGVHRHEFLDYVDSGMMGTPENDAPESFWQADVDEAAARLAAILAEEHADVVTIYDDHGGYGHPDHIQVHRVGVRATELAGTPRVYEATMDRDHFLDLAKRALSGELGIPLDSPVVQMAREMSENASDELFSSGAQITTRVDVVAFIDQKRRALETHRSQVGPDSWFLQMPPQAFALMFGTEHFVRRGAPSDTVETDLGLGQAS